MNDIKQNILALLQEKKLSIWELIIKNIDIFDDSELNQIYLIINQTDIEKLKELFFYQNSQAKALLDRVINLAREVNEIEKNIENHSKIQNETHLNELIDKNLDFNYSLS